MQAAQAELDAALARSGVAILTTGVLGWPAIERYGEYWACQCVMCRWDTIVVLLVAYFWNWELRFQLKCPSVSVDTLSAVCSLACGRRLVAAGVSVMLGNDNCYDFWCGVTGQASGLLELGLGAEEAEEAAPDMMRRAAAASPAHRNGESVMQQLRRQLGIVFNR